MLWGIAPESWAQLWSGVIGSFVAAIIGGLVALWVVRLTNGQQKQHASDARQIAAIADLLAAVSAMEKKYGDGPVAIQDLLLVVQAAAIRWVIEADDEKLSGELAHWPYHMGTLALKTHANFDSDKRETYLTWLFNAGSDLTLCGMAWPKGTPSTRDAHVLLLTVRRTERVAAMKALEEVESAKTETG
ncbi:hypothetical protein [Pseudarthrobacter polychromogenes]|uniref:Uncharacterized protein n=1 Tax=Pseudarthrobacter polychromogenes TaxID=1676 RepID=A0ABQ1XDD1_9MICC|nr:hypothetical protein [Pseudarthrobacter polychromogenes]GGG83822.1 hypothetical protein GCM10011577_01590 [Pseudarthrobacter polychromogenes]